MSYPVHLAFIPVVRIFLVCTAVFGITAFAFVITILLSRVIKTSGARRYKNVREEFQKTLNAMIILHHSPESFSHFSLNFYLKGLTQKITTSFGKQLLIDLLIANKQNLTGSSVTIFRKLFIRLRLKRFSQAKLGRYSLLKKVQGLQELAEMECVDALPAIQKLLKSKKLIIRQESFIALVRMAGTGSFALAEQYSGSITPWMQLTIHKHMVRMPVEKLPKFHLWFDNKNNELRKFAIIMAHQFRQSEAIPFLASLLEDRDIEIAGLAAGVLGNMGASEYAEAIADLGRKHPMNDALSLKVMLALEHIGSGDEHGDFLAWYMNHGSFTVRFQSMRVMKKLNLDCRNFLSNTNVSNDDSFESMYAHINEPLLQK